MNRGQGSIDHAVVIRHRERQHQARLEGLAIPDRRHPGAHDPQDRDLGALTSGVNAVPPIPPRLEIVKEALHVSRPELAVAGLLRHRAKPWLMSPMPLRSTSRITGTTNPSGVSTATPI